MPRRKQSNPQPVKADGHSEDCDPGCLVLDRDFLLGGELEFGDPDIMGLDQETGVTVFSLSVEENPSTPSDFPGLLSCKRCGQVLGDPRLGSGLDLGVGMGLGAELHCLSCEEGLQQTSMEVSGLSEQTTGRRGKTAADIPAKLHSCSLCAFTSRYSNHLKRHMRIHNGQKPYRCPACPYASAQLVNLQRHARTHTGEKPYGCPHCSYACSSLGNLRRHQRMHTQEAVQRRERRRGRRKKADAEEVTLRLSQDSAFLHTLGGLGSPTGPLPVLLFPLCCRVCGLTLEEADLEGDRAEGEAESDGGQACRRCSLDLLSKDDSESPCSPDTRRSRRSRRGQRRTELYRCPHCPFLSHYPNHLARHSHTHSEEKPHNCPHCSYTSSHQDNLKRHMRVHTGEKPYQCPACSYACGNLANLRRHQRIHSGSKPFHCAVCGYACNQSMNLKRHMLRHTGEKPYTCPQCDYSTGHLDNYKRHQKKHGHNADSWENHINGLEWGHDPQEGLGQGSKLGSMH